MVQFRFQINQILLAKANLIPFKKLVIHRDFALTLRLYHQLIHFIILCKMHQLLCVLVCICSLKWFIFHLIHSFGPLINLIHRFWLNRVIFLVVEHYCVIRWTLFCLRDAYQIKITSLCLHQVLWNFLLVLITNTRS